MAGGMLLLTAGNLVGGAIMAGELQNWSEYTKIFLGLYALVPPPIIIPLYLGIMAGRSPAEQRAAAIVGGLTFIVVMVSFAFLGTSILGAFGISLPAFRIAGGFLLLLIALDMMRNNPFDESVDKTTSKSSAFALGIVPLTIPVLAGPGAISAVVLLSSEHGVEGHRVAVAVVVAIVGLVIMATLLLASLLEPLFNKSVRVIFNKVMGLIICAIAFEFVMDGVADHFPDLRTIHDVEAITTPAPGH